MNGGGQSFSWAKLFIKFAAGTEKNRIIRKVKFVAHIATVQLLKYL